MSKAHFPHWRYIALRLHGDRPVSRRAMQNAITGRGQAVYFTLERAAQPFSTRAEFSVR